MKKKLLSLFLAAVVLVSTMSAAYASDEPKVIERFHIFAGTMASRMDNFSVYFYLLGEDDYVLGPSTSEVEYFNVTDDKDMETDEDFEEGKTYRATFSITIRKDRYTIDNPLISLDKGSLPRSPWIPAAWGWTEDADAVYLQVRLEGGIPGDDSSSSEDDSSSGGTSSEDDSSSDKTSSEGSGTSSSRPDQTTPDGPTVRPGSGSGKEEIVWQWSDSQKSETGKQNPGTGDGFKTGVSLLMAAVALTGAAMLMGKKK